MKKLGIRVLILLGSIVVLFLLGRITGMLQYYKCSTEANEPSIMKGDVFWISNVKQPKQFDFIVFKSTRQPGFDSTQSYNYVFRLVGIPGNVIEMRNGVLYVDNKNVDAGLQLMHLHKVSSEYARSVMPEDKQFMIDADSTYINITDEAGKKLGAQRSVDNSIIIPELPRYFGIKGSTDKFGPIKIPAGHYFVLGDNRHAASDSRYMGFVRMEDWVGTVVW